MGAGLCRNEGDDAEHREKSKDVFHSDETWDSPVIDDTSPAYSCTTKLFSVTRHAFRIERITQRVPEGVQGQQRG